MKNIFNLKNLKIAAYILVGLAAFLFVGVYLLGWYGDWKFNRDLEATRKEMERPYLEDTYGGKTPKETLEMFISAVEKEDFDLASKYFVLSKQEEWKKKLENGKEKNNLEWFLTELKRNNSTLDYIDPTSQMGNRKMYTIGEKMLMTFIKYPQGIWKIQEI